MRKATGIEKSPLTKRVLRSMPHVYSSICRGRLFYSRSIRGAASKKLYARHRSLFSMSEFEADHCKELRDQGYTILREFFDTTLIDKIYRKVDQLFRDCQIGTNINDPRKYVPVTGLTYEQLASSQPRIALTNPMLQIPEFVDIAFHESLLRIVANHCKYIPPYHQGLAIRHFPPDRPQGSDYFHRDNDHIATVHIFVYLVDINDTTGTQVYVPGSHRYDPKSRRPRLTRDLGVGGADGRFSDIEIKRHYPTWAFLRPKRGGVGIISGNGIHKGPIWQAYDDARNQPRTVLIMMNWGDGGSEYRNGLCSLPRRIARQDYERLSPFQRLFATRYQVVNPSIA